MGLFDTPYYKMSDSWKEEEARLSAASNQAAGESLAADRRMEDLAQFLHSQQQHSDSFEYKKMQFEYQQLEHEVVRKREAHDRAHYEWENHWKGVRR